MVFGCCVGDWGKFQANVAPYAIGPVIAMSGRDSIAAAYNAILDAAFVEWGDGTTVVLQHDDLQITDPRFAQKVAAASTERVAVIGVAGARGVTGLAWWNADTVGHQQTDAGLIDFPGGRAGDVDALEGSLLVFTPWAVRHLRFDHVPGFHGYDVSVCAKARAKGRRVVVADIDTHHHTMMGFKSAASHEQGAQADQAFREKATR